MIAAPALDSARIRDELVALDPDLARAEISALPYAYRTSHWLAELDVRDADGGRERLILKDLGPQSLDDEARRAKPAFLLEPLREIEVYRDVLAAAKLGTATLRGAIVRSEEERYWLVIERLEGVELYQTGSLRDWCAAAAWLAELHRKLRHARTPHLVRHDRDAVSFWIDRAAGFSGKASLLRLARRVDELADRLLEVEHGFLHGELFASNVIVHAATGRVSAIDWETAGIGPQLIDLAALTAGGWAAPDRTAIALAYRDAAGSDVGEEQFLSDLDLCSLYLAVQQLGLSAEWTPPREHAHDWARDVTMLGERLGLL
jgi:aminoglycoside phosphotransferase (APT) family kinase protein